MCLSICSPAGGALQATTADLLHQEVVQGGKCFALKSDGNDSVNPLSDADDAPGQALLSHSATREYRGYCQGCLPSQHN